MANEDFSTEALLEISVSEKSLKDAKSTIESRLGSVSVDVGSSGSGGAGPDRASKERAMSRKILSNQQQSLDSVATAWEENLELNQRRNLLLEEIFEALEKTGFSNAGGDSGFRFSRRNNGGGGGGGGGAGGAIAGTLGLLGAYLASGTVTGSKGDSGSGSDGGVVDPNSDLPNGYNTPTAFRNALAGRTPALATNSSGSGGESGAISAKEAVGGAGAAGGLYTAYRLASNYGRAGTMAASRLASQSVLSSTLARQEKRSRQTSGKTWWEQLFGNNGITSGVGGDGGMTTAMMSVPWQMMGFNPQRGQNPASQSKKNQQSPNINIDVTVDADGLTGREIDRALEKSKRLVKKDLKRELRGRNAL